MRMLCYGFLLTSLLLMSGRVLQSSCQTTIVTFTSKNPETLNCGMSGSTITVTWTERLNGKSVNILEYILPLDKITKSSDAKYANFDYTLEKYSFFNLVIGDVEKNDGGEYHCSTTGDSHTDRIYNVTVEVLRDVNITYLSQDVDVVNVTVGESYTITCSATGARSVDDLYFIWDPPLNETNNITITPNGNYTDYSITSTYTAVKGVSNITCQLTGYARQEEIKPELISEAVCLNVLYVPDCSLNAIKVNSDCIEVRLTCDCDASPQVITQYSFFNKGNLINYITINNVTTKVDYATTSYFSCYATNDIGHGYMSDPSTYICPGKLNTRGIIAGIVIVIIVIVICVITTVVVIVLLVKKNGR